MTKLLQHSFNKFLHRTKNIEGALTNKEAFFLYSEASKGGGKGSIVEIGSFKGRSTVFLAKGSKEAQREKVYAIDPHIGGVIVNKKLSPPTYQVFLRNIHNAKVADWIKPQKKYSHDAARNWKFPIRLLFIDGDHSYEGVKIDVLNWTQYVCDDGSIIFHDVLSPALGPVQVILSYLANKKEYRNFGFVDSIFFCQKGYPKRYSEKINKLYYIQVLKLVWVILKLSEFIKTQKIKIFLQQHVVKRWIKSFFSKNMRNNLIKSIS